MHTPDTTHRWTPVTAAPRGRVQVEYLLRVLPQGEIFQLLRDQVLAHSSIDPGKQWASSSAYLTYDKRTLTREAVSGAVDAAFAAGQKQYREIFEAYRRVIDAAARTDSGAVVRRVVELGDIFELRERRHEALACYEKALELGQSLSDPSPHLLVLRRMARLHQSLGHLGRAYRFYQDALSLAVDSRDAVEASASAMGMGNVKVDQGKWDQAEQHYLTARMYAEEAGDEFQLGQIWNNLSVVRRRMDDLDGAIGFSARAIRLFEGLENPGELSRCYNNRGLIEVDRGEFGLAEQSYRRAIELSDSHYVTAAIHGNLGDLYLRRGMHLLAETQARQAEEIGLRHGFNLILINIYRLLGTLSRLRRDPNGVTFFEKALEIARQYHYLHAEAEVHDEYGLFRQALGEAEEARDRFEKALAIYRALEAHNDVARLEERLRAFTPEVAPDSSS
jgi:tetratricopeptide (TPR) repeat protein